jgi:feruloyl esterase
MLLGRTSYKSILMPTANLSAEEDQPMLRVRLGTFLAAGFISAVRLGAASTCEGLTSLALPDTRITLARSIAAGGFTAVIPGQNPPAALPAVAFKDLPAFCRVAFSIKPSKDSDIKGEVWMPSSGWNGKLMGVGNGGYAGAIFIP